MSKDPGTFILCALFIGAFFALAGYPFFLIERRRIGGMFGVFVGIAVAVVFFFTRNYPFEVGLIAMIIGSVIFGGLFYSSITLMNVCTSFLIGAGLSFEIVTLVTRQQPSFILPVIVGVLCATGAAVLRTRFMMGILGLVGAAFLIVGIEAILFPQLMADSPLTMVVFHITPVQNALFIILWLLMSVGSYFIQTYSIQRMPYRSY